MIIPTHAHCMIFETLRRYLASKNRPGSYRFVCIRFCFQNRPKPTDIFGKNEKPTELYLIILGSQPHRMYVRRHQVQEHNTVLLLCMIPLLPSTSYCRSAIIAQGLASFQCPRTICGVCDARAFCVVGGRLLACNKTCNKSSCHFVTLLL